MAKRYRPVERDQVFLFPPCMRDWLSADHPVWLVIGAVEVMDTGPFHAARSLGGAGAPGYDPDMLVTVLAWAYANGVTSSRRIEQLCHTDVAFRVICGGNLPDHTTVARFRAGFAGPAASFFAEVLGLCAALGMGRLGVVALDGTKIAASASLSANRTEERLRKLAEEAVAAHARTDAEEDRLFGPARRGDEVPEEAWSPRSREQRIAAALAGIRAERAAAERAEAAKAEAFRARREAGQMTGPAPLSAAVALAEENLARARAARAARLAGMGQRYAAGEPDRRSRTAGVDDYVRVREAAARVDRAAARQAAAAARAAAREKTRKGPGRVRNVTDPDSRLMPVRGGGGFIQGYNAQNVTSGDGLIIATALTQDTADSEWFEPMTGQASQAAAHIAARRREPGGEAASIGLILADAGYCSEHNLTVPGPDRLIAVGKRRDLEKAAAGCGGAGPRRDGQAAQAMAGRLKTGDAITAYRQRGHIAETPHGHLKHNMGFRQLSVRGLARTTAEWTFACTVHNLFKAISAGMLTQAALDNLAR